MRPAHAENPYCTIIQERRHMIGLDETEINFPLSSTHPNSPIYQQKQELSFSIYLP